MDSKEQWPALEPKRAEPEAAAIAEIATLAKCAACGRTTFEDLWGDGDLCGLCFDASMP